LAVYYYHIY